MKQKRMMLMLGGVLVVLIGCYVGLKAWNDHQQEQAEADEEAAKIRLVEAEGLTAVSYTDGESTLGFYTGGRHMALYGGSGNPDESGRGRRLCRYCSIA